MTLDHLWAAWRAAFLDSPAVGSIERHDGCVFCELLASSEPPQTTLVLGRTPSCAVILNLYPYTSGHVLVLPRRHVSSLSELSNDEANDLWATIRRAHDAVVAAYAPDGLNVGANLGRAAGAGIPDHLHFHVLPRWSGDTNFTTTIASTRVIPEALDATWAKLSTAWEQAAQ